MSDLKICLCTDLFLRREPQKLAGLEAFSIQKQNVPRDDAMLLVPFKKAPPVDLVQPVTFYVEANYSPEDAEAFKADIQSLQVINH